MIHSRRTDASATTDPGDLPEPTALRRLRLLVTALIVVLILGMITVAATLVIRLGGPGGSGVERAAPFELDAPSAPALILPEGHEVTALGRAEGEILILTRDPAGGESLRSFDVVTGAARSVTEIRRAPQGSGGDDAAR